MRLIGRAAALLRALADEPEGLTLGELANATGLARSTVQRVVGALEVERLVSTNPGQPGVRLGLEISRLSASVQRDVRDLIRPYMDELHRKVQETIDLSILNGDCAIVIDQLASPQSLRVVSHVGRPLPLHCTASGKAHLSQLSDADIRNVLNGSLRKYTPATMRSVPEVIREIREGEGAGCFVDNGEFAEGVCAIGVAVTGFVTGNFALAISMPTQRFAERFSSYAAIMRDVGRAVAASTNRYPATGASYGLRPKPA
jgi:IclR family transcriptional regulator, acetate operon repressor